jgi:hypothetical protein
MIEVLLEESAGPRPSGREVREAFGGRWDVPPGL